MPTVEFKMSSVVIDLEFLGFKATLYKTIDFGWTVNFPHPLEDCTQEELRKFIMFCEYVEFFVQELNQ